MKRLLTLLTLSSLILTSCNDKDQENSPIVTTTAAPEDLPVQSDGSDDDSSVDNSKDQSATTKNSDNSEDATYQYECVDNVCPDNLGYVHLENGSTCQAMKFQKSFMVSKTCFKEEVLESTCSTMKISDGENSYKCLSVKNIDGKFYEVRTGYGDSFELENLFTGPEEVNEVSELSFKETTKKTITKDNKCSVDFLSANHLDTFDYDSTHFYSRDCEEDFIFINHMLAGVKVDSDDYGVKYFNLKCVDGECREDVTLKEKVIGAYLNSDNVAGRLANLNSPIDTHFAVLDSVTFDVVNDGEIIHKRPYKCIKKPVELLRKQLVYYPYEIDLKGNIKFKNTQTRKEYVYYYISYLYDSHPFLSSVVRDDTSSKNNAELSSLFDDNSSLNVAQSAWMDYSNIRNLLSSFQVYGPYNRRNSYGSFVQGVEKNIIQDDKKTIVPKCSSVL